ncbi:MAG: hypothetical protein C0501_29420 [Isosphaera sp.]|nr:hypothetical protein [Isosphaera sp.]
MSTRPASLSLAVALVLAAAAPRPVAGQAGARVVVATSDSPAAAFSGRPANGTVYTTLGDKAEVFSGDLMVALPAAKLTCKSGAVAVTALADFDGRSTSPVFETAFSIAEAKNGDADLDLALDRGRVDLANVKAAGAATARLRFWDQNWKVTLDGPGTRVAVELYGRWPTGTRFKPAEPGADPAKGPAPVASLVLVVLSGSASADVGGTTVAMKAPPGPAELRWNSLSGVRPQPQKLTDPPGWADPAPQTEDGKKAAAACEKFRVARAADPAKAFDTFLASADVAEQRVALVTLGGLDDFQRLGQTLAAAKTLDQWDFGVTVMRHWLGRGRGYDQRLYEVLVAGRGYTPAQAQTVVQLLFGFTAGEVGEPETYEVLIDYLAHEKPAIRNLAAWHLVRLAPAGKAIPFNPSGTAADAEACRAAWKKLIPAGTLPGKKG